jgi:hypothetical protein
MGPLDEPERLDRPHGQGRHGLYEHAFRRQVADPQRFEGLHGTPQIADDLEPRGRPPVG